MNDHKNLAQTIKQRDRMHEDSILESMNRIYQYMIYKYFIMPLEQVSFFLPRIKFIVKGPFEVTHCTMASSDNSGGSVAAAAVIVVLLVAFDVIL